MPSVETVHVATASPIGRTDTLVWAIYLYHPMARTPKIPPSPQLTVISESLLDAMVLLLPFITLALAGMVVPSVGSDVGRHKSRMEGNLKRRDIVDCSDSQTSFVGDS
jgi:hypothetical protein